MLKVAVVVEDGVNPFELGVAGEVFGDDRSERGVPAFDYRVVTPVPGPVSLDLSPGAQLLIEHDLSFVDDADVVVVPAYRYCRTADNSPLVTEAVRGAHERGAWILTMCTGAFVAARAGILNGRRATTHWSHADEFERQFPAIDVDCGALFVEDGNVITSAGTAAAIDAALHLVRILLGARPAAVIARGMVVPPIRDGGQSQYAVGPVTTQRADTLAPLIDWMLEHLTEEHAVADLAARAHLSPRTFARRFRDELGTTPAAWLTAARLRRAQELLESGDHGLDVVAAQSGFGSATLMRHHFQQQLGTTPSAYRRRFSVPGPASARPGTSELVALTTGALDPAESERAVGEVGVG